MQPGHRCTSLSLPTAQEDRLYCSETIQILNSASYTPIYYSFLPTSAKQSQSPGSGMCQNDGVLKIMMEIMMERAREM